MNIVLRLGTRQKGAENPSRFPKTMIGVSRAGGGTVIEDNSCKSMKRLKKQRATGGKLLTEWRLELIKAFR